MSKRLLQAVERAVTRTHIALYRLTRGRVGGKWGKARVLLLTTKGRTTGKPRTTPVFYLREDGVYALVASGGGRAQHPGWYRNLLANPEAEIEVDGEKIAVRSETAAPEQRARLWPQFVAVYKGYDTYRQKTTREIPIVLLRPSG